MCFLDISSIGKGSATLPPELLLVRRKAAFVLSALRETPECLFAHDIAQSSQCRCTALPYNGLLTAVKENLCDEEVEAVQAQ